MFSDKCDNEILQNVVSLQKERYLENKNNKLTLVLDDFGNSFKSRQMRSMMDSLYSTARHAGILLICAVQSITMMTGTQITNSSQWCIWAADARQLKKITTELSTATMEPKELEAFIKDVTKVKYNFVYIDTTQERDEDVFHRNFE